MKNMHIYICYNSKEGLRHSSIFGRSRKEHTGTFLVSEDLIKEYRTTYPNMIYKKLIDCSSAEINASLHCNLWKVEEIIKELDLIK